MRFKKISWRLFAAVTAIRNEFKEKIENELAAGFNAAEIRLTGNVVGQPPFRGTLSHRGWKVDEVRLPKLAEGHSAAIIAPAEVEL